MECDHLLTIQHAALVRAEAFLRSRRLNSALVYAMLHGTLKKGVAAEGRETLAAIRVALDASEKPAVEEAGGALRTRVERAEAERDALRAAFSGIIAVPPDHHEIRRNDDNTVDEVIAWAWVHVEQMDRNHWWMSLDTPGGRLLHLHFYAKGAIALNVEDEGPSTLWARMRAAVTPASRAVEEGS